MFFNKKQNPDMPNGVTAETEKGDYKVKRSKTLDIVMLVVSLLAAIALWGYVYSSTNTTDEKTFNLVTIEKKNTDSLFEDYNLVVQSMNIDTLNVSVMGSRDAINNIDISDIKAYVNLSGITEANDYRLEVFVDVPEGITCVGQTVSHVEVTVDASSVRNMTVTKDNVILNGWALESGYYFSDISTNVTSVRLEGSSGDVNKVHSVGIMTGTLGTIKNNMTSHCEIVLLDSAGNRIDLPGVYVTPNESNAEAYINVHKEKTIPLEFSTTYGYISSEYINITPAEVVIKGEPSAVDAINSIPLGEINDKNISLPVYENTFDIKLEGVEITDVKGNAVQKADVKIDLSDLPRRIVSGVALYSGDLLLGSIDVTLVVKTNDSMCEGMLAQITADEIKAYIQDGMSLYAIEISDFYTEYLFECGNFVPIE